MHMLSQFMLKTVKEFLALNLTSKVVGRLGTFNRFDKYHYHLSCFPIGFTK